MDKPSQSTSFARRTPRRVINITASGDLIDDVAYEVRVNYTQTTGKEIYTRTYIARIDDEDQVTFPNDLTSRIQTLLRSLCLCIKYPNTYADDA